MHFIRCMATCCDRDRFTKAQFCNPGCKVLQSSICANFLSFYLLGMAMFEVFFFTGQHKLYNTDLASRVGMNSSFA